MPLFAYRAINSYGEIVKGIIDESSKELAYDNVSASGLHVLKISKSSSLSDMYLKKTRAWSVKANDIVEFAGSLSVMQRAGLPLLTSLSDLSESTDNKYFKEKILDIMRMTELGSSFSDALRRHKDVFPDIFINLISVGEETGRLSESLADIAVHLQRMEDLKKTIIRALMYPAFALFGTFGALLFWLIYVLPQMSTLFTAMSVELPALTVFLIKASDFSRSNWYVFPLAPVVVFIVLKMLSRHKVTKYYLDAAKLRIPVLKLIIFNMLLTLFAEQLRILVTAGVTIDKSLNIMAGVINNSVYSRALLNIRDDIMLGSMISDSIKKQGRLFPSIVSRMISIGESAGSLNEQLNYLSEYYLEKLDDISQKMAKMIEPIIVIVIGGMFLVIIIGLLSPIYDLVAGMGK